MIDTMWNGEEHLHVCQPAELKERSISKCSCNENPSVWVETKNQNGKKEVVQNYYSHSLVSPLMACSCVGENGSKNKVDSIGTRHIFIPKQQF